jgi:hypothetical protein
MSRQNYSHVGPFVVCNAQQKIQIPIHFNYPKCRNALSTQIYHKMAEYFISVKSEHVHILFQNITKLYVNNSLQPFFKNIMQKHVHDDT